MAKVIDLEDYKRNLLKELKGDGVAVTLENLNEWTTISDERLAWLALCEGYKAVELFLRSLFYDNHKARKGRNLDSAFIIGFSEQHLDSLEERVLRTLDELGRSFLLINAMGKTFIQMVQEATGEEFRTEYDAYQALAEILLTTDTAVVFKGFSASKVPSKLKGGHIRSLIKTIDDAHFNDVVPQSDLIFLDTASFLQKIWSQIGEYVKVSTFR